MRRSSHHASLRWGRTDGDDDGIACEDLIGDGSNAAEDQYTTKMPPADVSNPKGVVPGTAVEKKVPDTGGPPIIIGALVLLAGSPSWRGLS